MGKPSQLRELVANLDVKMDKVKLRELLKAQLPTLSCAEIEALLACRQLKIGQETCTNLETLYPAKSKIEIVRKRYVSRGGYKLEKALTTWPLEVRDKVMVDAGSSSGGFSDCLLQNGAALVHAIDVGYNLLDYSLRVDKRVVVHERQNIMEKVKLEPPPHAAVADLSFRSIVTAADHILSLTQERWMVALIKPQFEVPKGAEDFNGVLDDDELLFNTLLEVFKALKERNVGFKAIMESPIRGRKGNREFLAHLERGQWLSEAEFVENLHRLI